MSPSHLAELTGMTRGAASRLLDRLVHKSLVTREGRDDDRRYQDIRLTPAGRRLVPSLAALADQNDRELFAPLTPKERGVLLAILKKLAHAHTLHTIPTE
jgi:DNA-binding MarR family transcriptional regulator